MWLYYNKTLFIKTSREPTSLLFQSWFFSRRKGSLTEAGVSKEVTSWYFTHPSHPRGPSYQRKVPSDVRKRTTHRLKQAHVTSHSARQLLQLLSVYPFPAFLGPDPFPHTTHLPHNGWCSTSHGWHWLWEKKRNKVWTQNLFFLLISVKHKCSQEQLIKDLSIYTHTPLSLSPSLPPILTPNMVGANYWKRVHLLLIKFLEQRKIKRDKMWSKAGNHALYSVLEMAWHWW